MDQLQYLMMSRDRQAEFAAQLFIAAIIQRSKDNTTAAPHTAEEK
jgi:hypothetical protein